MHGRVSRQETATGTRWVLPELSEDGAEALAAELGEPLWFARLLYRRGLRSSAETSRYLRPLLNDLHDPCLMAGMDRAVDRILLAIRERQGILIYGDYDVDGTMATVLLKTAIDRVTPEPVAGGAESLVRYHIPHRIREGYGMQTAVLSDVALAGVQLVISVDTGIRAFAAADEARRLRMDLIVTDHHLPDDVGVPDAYAVVHPNQAGCAYPFKQLCGAAVAYKVAEALLRRCAGLSGEHSLGVLAVPLRSVEEKLLPSFLKLVAIATVADAVPLLGENRSIVQMGLAHLRQPRQHGLRSLMTLAGVSGDDGSSPTATDVAFRLAPRINAAGRMDVATDVVQLLLTRDPAEGRRLAEKLHRLNDERRAVEATVLLELQQQVEVLRRHPEGLHAHGCLSLDGESWHRGVVGIAASRVVEWTGLPALVMAHENGEAHGSGRSIAGFHLLDALTAAHAAAPGGLFHRFGGHAHAVGFSLPSARVPELRERLRAYALGRITAEMLEQTLAMDAELGIEELSGETLRRVRSLEPFGQGNREPVFLARRVTLCQEPRLLKGKHLKLRLRSAGGAVWADCLCWSRAVDWPERLRTLGIGEGTEVDVAYRLRENTHPDFGGPELELCDVREHTELC